MHQNLLFFFGWGGGGELIAAYRQPEPSNPYKRRIIIKLEQDLNTLLMCCSLGSSLKIMLCRFFLMGWNFIF